MENTVLKSHLIATQLCLSISANCDSQKLLCVLIVNLRLMTNVKRIKFKIQKLKVFLKRSLPVFSNSSTTTTNSYAPVIFPIFVLFMLTFLHLPINSHNLIAENTLHIACSVTENISATHLSVQCINCS